MQDQSWIELGRVTDVGLGEHYVYSTEIGNIMIINISGEFYGLDDICTHDGGTLSDGWLEKEDWVCPRHGAHFCIKTGEAGPPAYEPVNTYPVKVTDGKLCLKIR